MDIESRVVLRAVNHRHLPVIYTTIKKDKYLAAIITTVVMGNAKDKCVTDTTKKRINQFSMIHEKAFPDGVIYLVELSTLNNVDSQVEKSLVRTKDEDAIVYLCNQAGIYERVIFDLFLEPGG